MVTMENGKVEIELKKLFTIFQRNLNIAKLNSE